MHVAGIDGCSAGWIAVAAPANDLRSARATIVKDLAVWLETEAIGLAVIDIPIGFTSGPEPRDVESSVRASLRGKASSVFSTPCRAALAENDYREACRVNEQHLGRRLSRQTFALFPKMREVDAVVRQVGQAALREGHPEVSFACLAGAPLLSRKREELGRTERIAALEIAGIPASDLLAQPRPMGSGADDVLDAAVLMWSAARALRHEHLSFPPAPSRDAAGLEMSVIA